MIQVPDGWEIKPLKDILSIQYGKDQKEVELVNGKYPILGSGGVIGYTNHFLYDKPSVLIGRKGTINNPQYMETPFWTVDTLFYSHIKNKNVPKWVYYVFQSINWDSYNEASGVPSLSTANINRIEILRPIIKEQEKIAKILSTLDNAIESTNRIIEKERNIKTALMQELLTNGIDQNSQIRTPQTHIYKPSELGLIPDEWEATSINLLLNNLDSKRIPLKESDRQEINGQYPYYGASGIIDWVDDYIFDGEYILLGEDGENVVSRVLPLAFKASGKIWVNNHAHVFQCKKDVNIDYVVNLLESTDYKSIINGSAQPKITQDGLNKLFFKIAPKIEQKQIAKILNTQDKKIEKEEENLSKLKELKKGLMNNLLSGVVSVKV